MKRQVFAGFSLFFAAAVSGQSLVSLNPTADGEQIYFRPSHPGGLFRYDRNQLESFAPDMAAASFAVTGDGRSVALSFNGRTTIHRDAAPPIPLAGELVSLSPNGRYLLLSRNRTFSLRDLSTGVSTELTPGSVPLGSRTVSDSGQVLTFVSNLDRRLSLWSPGSAIVSLSQMEGVRSAAINAWGTRALVHTSDYRLYYLDIATGYSPLLSEHAASPSISYDGRFVVYLAFADLVSQVFLFDVESSLWRQLTHSPVDIVEAVVSGFGNAVWATDRFGGLFRIDLPSGSTRRFPAIQSARPELPLIPGSLSSLEGGPFADATVLASYPLPDSLAGVRVLVDGRPMKLVSVTPNRIQFLVPPDASGPVRELPMTVEYPGRDPLHPLFVPEPRVELGSATPRFLVGPSLTAGYLPASFSNSLVFHQDFSRRVTSVFPATRGEIVHLYGIGFGPVDQAVDPTGPAPSSPPARVLNPPRCQSALSETVQVPVRFAGLAPGLAGVYQISLEIPNWNPSNFPGDVVSLEVRCATGGPTASIPVRIRP